MSTQLKLPLLLICLVAFGCGTMSNARGYATIAIYAAQHKQLVFAPSPCGGPDRPNNPYLVSGWVRERDLNDAVIVCKPGCIDCKIEVKKTSSRPLKGDAIAVFREVPQLP